MDAVYTLKRENPRNKANILSKLFFVWMVKLCYKGTRKSLEVIDLYKTRTCDQSEKLANDLQKNWEEEVNNSKFKIDTGPSLLRVILKTFFWKYMGFGILLFLQLMVLKSMQPLVLAYFINLFSDDKPRDFRKMYIFGGVLVTMSFLMVVAMHNIDFQQDSIGMRIRIAVSSLVYRKMLKLNKKSLGETAAGQVVNLLSNDVNRFDNVMITLHYLWMTPLQLMLITCLMWREMGISTLAGVLFMSCLTLAVQDYLAKLSSKFRLQTAHRTDHRVRLMNELISGIQIIKMYAWEKPFEHIVKIARIKEINSITKTSYLKGINISFMDFIEPASIFLTVTCYVLLRNPITADKVFSVAQYFNVLSLSLAFYLPLAIFGGAETLVTVRRLREFLLLEEKSMSSVEFKSNESVNFCNVEASWTPDSLAIRNFTLCVPPGTLCAIVGPVGAGKSSILQMVLGELPISSGSLRIGGSIAYSSQEPWLFASSVRNNILFGLQYDRELYKKVVKLCALERDFKQFPQGDSTIVGERGVALSGGQRARVNLARAVYRQAEIYLLDDPLSAVDTRVGKHLFEKCILRYLKNKTRILVTHQLQYLKEADHIVVVNEGRIEAQGPFTLLVNSNVDFTKFLIAEDEDHERKEILNRTQSIMSHKSIQSDISEPVEKVQNMEEMGHSDSSSFRDYIKAAGNCCSLFGLLGILALTRITCSGADFWITVWTQQETIRNSNRTQIIQNNTSTVWYEAISDGVVHYEDTTIHLIKRDFFMYFYSAIIILAIALALGRSFVFFKMAMNASKGLHNQMFHALLQAPMRFFDTNPSGRVLNRFAKDMGAIDEIFPKVLINTFQVILGMIGTLVLVVIANYYILIIVVIIGFVFLKMINWYVATAKDIKHLEGITKSNVFSHLNSSCNGITTIRASQAEDILTKEFDLHQDTHTSAWFLTIATKRSFSLWLDLVTAIFVATVIFGFIFLSYISQVSGSFAGLAISEALMLTGVLQYGMRQIADVVNQLASVERVMQYTKLDNEHKNEKPPEQSKATWPTNGSMEFRDLTLRYSESESPVLRNLNFFIAAGTKIGIVGRTGAGKSSLISALFRLAPIEGHILVDDVDTKTIPLTFLRKRISIIPQEPVLFPATLRYNLDPFQEFEDGELWDVLEQVELKESIKDLDVMVTEGGGNFSLGQRQLLCLARAILRNNKILVLDEATANVDPRTDSLIQETIRRKFHDCTVLTIAHRLNTIMDSDKVLVMSSGRMKEFDHPHLLLQRREGAFTKLVEETGPAMSQQLKQAAEEFYAKSILTKS